MKSERIKESAIIFDYIYPVDSNHLVGFKRQDRYVYTIDNKEISRLGIQDVADMIVLNNNMLAVFSSKGRKKFDLWDIASIQFPRKKVTIKPSDDEAIVDAKMIYDTDFMVIATGYRNIYVWDTQKNKQVNKITVEKPVKQISIYDNILIAQTTGAILCYDLSKIITPKEVKPLNIYNAPGENNHKIVNSFYDAENQEVGVISRHSHVNYLTRFGVGAGDTGYPEAIPTIQSDFDDFNNIKNFIPCDKNHLLVHESKFDTFTIKIVRIKDFEIEKQATLPGYISDIAVLSSGKIVVFNKRGYPQIQMIETNMLEENQKIVLQEETTPTPVPAVSLMETGLSMFNRQATDYIDNIEKEKKANTEQPKKNKRGCLVM